MNPAEPQESAAASLTVRFLTGLAVACVGLFAVLCATAFVEADWRHSVDSAIYLLTAKSMSLGEGYTYLGRPFFARPPALSWTLSHFMGEEWDFRLANQLIQLSVGATLITLLLALSRIHGWLRAAVVTLLFAINPLVLRNHNNILAEYPFLALFFAAVWLLSTRRDGSQPAWFSTVLGALLLAAAVSFRTVGVLFLPGLVLLALFPQRGLDEAPEPGPGRRPRRNLKALAAAGLVALSLVPWSLYCSEAATQAERPSTQLLMFDYSTALFHTNPRDPASPLVDGAGWWARIADNAVEISQTLTHAFLGGPANEALSTYGSETNLLSALLAACLLFTLCVRRSALDLFAASCVALLLLYFTFADRLLLPLIPLLISSVIFTLDSLGRGLGRLTKGSLSSGRWQALLLALFALGLGGLSATRFQESRELTSTKRRFQRDDLATADWVRNNLPSDARLLHEKGAVLSVLTGRTTYTYRNLAGPWPESCPEVDFAIFSPRPRREPTEDLLGLVAKPPILVPFKWKGQMSNIRIYALDPPSGH